MPELTTRTPTREAPGGPIDPLDPFAADEAADPSSATVSSGMYTERVSTNGATVAELRRRLADRLDIDPNARAVIDGDIVGDEDATTLQAGQLLTFVRHAGEKGSDVFLDDGLDLDWFTVGSGLYTERFVPDGGTVATWRQRLAERMEIEAGARAYLDGSPVADEAATPLAGGQTLAFVRHVGEMG